MKTRPTKQEIFVDGAWTASTTTAHRHDNKVVDTAITAQAGEVVMAYAVTVITTDAIW